MCLILYGGLGQAQDLQQIGRKDPVSLSGGLSTYAGVYASDLDDPRMVPFTWGFTGRVTLSIYDLQLPFSFIISEKERDFRQPFNQYGVSPRYKWATAHIGHRSMHFSELTMSGQRFFGGGIELSPKKFRFAAMYGQLRREVFADTLTEAYVEPAFQRTGMAAKIGVGSQATHVDLVLFRAKDAYDAIHLRNGRYGTALPEENLVMGVDASVQLAKRLQWEFNGAGSLHNVGLTPDTREAGAVEISNRYDSFLFNMDQRTRRGTALKTGLSYNMKGVTFSVNHDRIDPLFRTLGNYFFMNDVENYRGSVAFGAFKQKVRMALSMGLQTNDLTKALAARTRRTIGSANISYNSGKALTTSLSWSNFEADMRSAFEAAGADTLRFRQVSDNIMLSNSLRFRNANGRTRTADIALSYQGFVNEGYPSQPTTTTVTWTGSLGYRESHKPIAFSWGVRLTATTFDADGNDRVKYGASLNTRKGFNKDRTGIHGRVAAYVNRGSIRGASTSVIASAGVDQRVGRSHRFGIGANYNGRSASERTVASQYQLRVQLTYSLDLVPRANKPQSP